MYQNILLDIKDGIAVITLNRPEKLNAYIVEMGEEIVDVFEELKENDDIRVIILTGSGRGFCAGVDLDHLKAQLSGEHVTQGPKIGEERFVTEFPLYLMEYSKPVIVAINGHAIGVGITMTLPCDIRIAAASAKIGLTFAKMGILPGLGSTMLLSRLIGPAKARELTLTGKIITAQEAAAMGLVNKVVADDQVMAEALAMAKQIIECDANALVTIKYLLYHNDGVTLAEAMQKERECSAMLRKMRQL